MEKERKQKPRGIRNNNPLNIVQTKDKWQGLRVKQYDKRFCEFIDMAHGYRAAFVILKNYIKKHGWNTIEQIVSHWAPKNENDTAVYIFAVCNFMDVKKDHVMDFGNMPDMLMLVSIRRSCIMTCGGRCMKGIKWRLGRARTLRP